MSTPDRLEHHVIVRAPVPRVWRALTDTAEFSQWFGFTIEDPFVVGAAVRGTFGGTLDEGAIRGAQMSLGVTPSGIRPPAPHAVFCVVEKLEPERLFAFQWVPYGIDAEADPANEPMTLVEFRLAPVAEGTRLTIVESGFDRVPAHRRLRAFRMNDGGWAAQAQNVKAHVERD